jgi:predicted DNA-binding ribbon-helix-helix protein
MPIRPADRVGAVATAAGGGPTTPSAKILKHSLAIAGHRTSISLEAVFWAQLKTLAEAQGLSLAGLVAAIDEGRGEANLSSAIRVYVLEAALKKSVRAFSSEVDTGSR